MCVELASLLSANCNSHSAATLYAFLCTTQRGNCYPAFSLNMLYGLEKELDSVFSGSFGAKWEEVNKTTVTKCDKGTLVNLALSAVCVLGRSKNTLRSAAVRVEHVTQEVIVKQNALVKLQDDLLTSKSEQMEAVLTTVKSEIRSFRLL